MIRVYSLPQKHCTKFSNEKSMFFLTVNLFENWHASTYNMCKYIYKVKKNAIASVRPPAAARRGQSKRHLRALYVEGIYIYRRKEKRKNWKAICVQMYSARGGSYDQDCQNGYKSGMPSVTFFLLYICNYRCHR